MVMGVRGLIELINKEKIVTKIIFQIMLNEF